MKKYVKISLWLLGFFLFILVGFIKIQFHTRLVAKDYTSDPVLPADVLELVANSPYAVGNVTVNYQDRLFMTVHPEANPIGNKLLEYRNRQWIPYPNLEFQTQLVAPMGLVINEKNRLYVLDHGLHSTSTPKLYVFQLGSEKLIDEYSFDRDVAPLGAYLQDLQVDQEGRFVYIADVGFWTISPAIVVLDLKDRRAWRKLHQHPSVMPQRYRVINPIKEMKFFGLVGFRTGVDGIALSHDEKYLYYSAMNHSHLFSVQVQDLKNPTRDATQSVKMLSPKPISDGMSIDADNRVYITDVERSAIHTWHSEEGLRTLIRSPKIRWADALSFGPGGYLYLADSAIPELVMQSKEHIESKAPFQIYRLRVSHKGRIGH